ncbi:uncharacterized protein LOC34617588 [Cyclospora cayetanensis]|uniref:Uncharacterized protein LOC34617588 n=1 Tax=Cyclospora cayetanensis TaxID=88456 RepID=A0A6P6RUB3_9EIME|nr:uncharacterized protein LOC34617588 [Cyclospora cayetanensis]
MEAIEYLGETKVVAAHQLQQGDGTAPPELLSFAPVGVACCSSSSPAGADEVAEDWGGTYNFTEAPVATEQGACYCCADTGCSGSSSSSNCKAYRWWSPHRSKDVSASSGKDSDDLDCSTVCSSSSRPEGPLDIPVESSFRGVDCSSSPSSEDGKWSGRLHVPVKEAIRSGSSSPYSASSPSIGSESSGRVCSRNDAHCPLDAAAALQQDTIAKGQNKKSPESDTRATQLHGSFTQGAPGGITKHSFLEVGGQEGLQDEVNPDHRSDAPATAAAGVSPSGAVAAPPDEGSVALSMPAPVATPRSAKKDCPSDESCSRGSNKLPQCACLPGAPSVESRLCYCLEHLLLGVSWGPLCLCGTLQEPAPQGAGCCRGDHALVNPQQELELLLQRAAQATAATDWELPPVQGPPHQLPLASRVGMSADSHGKRSALKVNCWAPRYLGTDDSAAPGAPPRDIYCSVSPSRITASAAMELPKGPLGALSVTEGPHPFPLAGLSWMRASTEDTPPVSDWGSPTQQWEIPHRAEVDPQVCSPIKAKACWHPSSHKKRASAKSTFAREDGDDGQGSPCRLPEANDPFVGLERQPSGHSTTLNRYPRTALSVDFFVSTTAFCSESSEDEARESALEDKDPMLPLVSLSPRSCNRGAFGGIKTLTEGRRRREGATRERERPAEGCTVAKQTGQGTLLPPSRTNGATFSLRPSPHQHLMRSPVGGPYKCHEDTWGDTQETEKQAKGHGGPSAYGGSLWRDNGRHSMKDATSSGSVSIPSSPLGIAAVPVRTRKGFRKPLPLPPQMLAAIAAAGPRKSVDPVLQYDGESREWRVFWMEEPQARYKVFQSKKFGKERAQQLALEWLRRAKAGAIHGSGRGPRGSAGSLGYRVKRGRHEGPPVATEYKHSSPETFHFSTPHSTLALSPEGSPALAPFPTAFPAL